MAQQKPLTKLLSFYDFRFYCVEQYMHAAKALIFNDVNTFVQIMESKLPSEAKKLGRQVKVLSSEMDLAEIRLIR
jgi:predicted NAD-dependent protein-ADP-ribosyltransferase YbiA (DUF1768 family)